MSSIYMLTYLATLNLPENSLIKLGFSMLQNIIKTSFAIIFLAGISTHVSLASSLNIDFGTALSGNSYGAASGQTGYWNNITHLGLTENLVDTSGVATNIDLSLSAEVAAGNGALPLSSYRQLVTDNFFSFGSWYVSLAGLDPGTYDIFYYAPGHTSVSTGGFTVNGIEVPSLSGSRSAFSQGIAWDVLSGVSVGPLGVLEFISLPESGPRGLAGLQILTAVPIPAAVWLFGSSLLGLIGFSKRKKVA